MSTEHTFGNTGLDDEGPAPKNMVLADLTAALTETFEDKIEWFRVPNRPTVEVAFRTYIEYDTLRMWSKKATQGKRFNPLQMAYIVLSNLTAGVRVNGEEVLVDGEPVTLVHQEFLSTMKVSDFKTGVRKLYGSDGHIISTMQEVMEKAGYGDDELDVEGDVPLS
jgi:hypothetical protein